jgi:surface antigen
MTQSTSSAIPDQLLDFDRSSQWAAQEVYAESNVLKTRLMRFETECTEPGFCVRVDDLIGFHDLGISALDELAAFVRRVGQQFLDADRIWPGPQGLAQWSVYRSVTSWAAPPGTVYAILPWFISVPAWLQERLSAFFGKETPDQQAAVSAPLSGGTLNTASPSASPAPSKRETEAATPKKGEQCVAYAKRRRSDFAEHSIGPADNLINIYSETIFQLDENTTDLTSLAEGYAIVWHRDHGGGINSDAGHVAIIDEVGPDYVLVSEANPVNVGRQIPLSKLTSNTVYFIP